MKLLLVNINRSRTELDGCQAIARTIRKLGSKRRVSVDIVHYPDADARNKRTRYAGLIIGPNGDPFPSYPKEFDDFLTWLRRRRKPTLGICGGHQALALAHGAPVGPVANVPAARDSYAGMPKQTGLTRIRWMGDPDPLLDGVSGECEVVVSHVDEVKDLPYGFRLLAIGDPCHVQAIRADRRPMWGVQFHPEKPCEDPSGHRILANFIGLCRP